MENCAEGEGTKPTNEEDVQAGDAAAVAPEPETAAPRPPSRTPFTSLSQVEADLALARALQEQERAYVMLTRNGGGGGDEGSDYGSSEEDYGEEEGEEDDGAEHHHDHDHPVVENGVEYEEEEEEELAEEEEEAGEDGGAGEEDGDSEPEINPADFDSDEAYARALQEAEGWGIAARLMALAGLGGWGGELHEEHDNDAQDAGVDVDPDEYSYEELVALGEVVGTESRGLSADTIASLPFIHYKAESTQDGNTEQCVICRLDYEDGESLVELSCKHTYHPECINKWLQINKVCPVCNTEVSMAVVRQE